jgi:hypothetical protein
VDLEGIDQDLAAGAGWVRHGSVILRVFGRAAPGIVGEFYASWSGEAFEMATPNYRKGGHHHGDRRRISGAKLD